MKTVYNPDEANRFAAWLDEESGRVMLDLRDTAKVLTDLQSSWNDAKYNDYMRTFDASTEALARFREHAERYVAYLRKKSAYVKEYLG
ncbi:MAG: hypothetical protein M9910_04710 [Kiritimatiellae bacterium]|nr:hypothetical protein [Kiritimatiellia bacterium]